MSERDEACAIRVEQCPLCNLPRPQCTCRPDDVYGPDVRSEQGENTGANPLAGDAARHDNGDSNSEKAPSIREAFAWLYQWAGTMNAPAMVLDNLSALARGNNVPHAWVYPAMPEQVDPLDKVGRGAEKCIHAKLQLQLIVPEECLVRGDIGAWYLCLQCGSHFRSDIRPYVLKVGHGKPAEQGGAMPVSAASIRQHERPKITKMQAWDLWAGPSMQFDRMPARWLPEFEQFIERLQAIVEVQR